MKSKRGELRWLMVVLSSHWHRHLGLIITAILTSVMTLVDPLIIGWLIDSFIKSRSTSVPLIGACLAMAAYEARLWLSAINGTWTADTYQQMVMELRLKLLEHFDRLSLDYHETTPLGAKSFVLIDSVDDIAAVGAEIIPLFTRSVLVGVAICIAMVVINPRLSMVLLSALPLYLLTTRYFKRQIWETTEAANGLMDRMSQYIHEHLDSIPQIQMLQQESMALKRARNLFAQVKYYQKARVKSEIRYSLVNGTITALGTAVILGYGGYLARIGAISIGSLVVCYSYLARLFEPINALGTVHAKFQKSISSIQRLQRFLNLTPSVASPAFCLPVRNAESVLLECNELSFSYTGGRRAISGLTYDLHPGEHVSIAGRSGAGKSTAAKLIARLYDPQAGTVKINGEDVRQVDLKQFRRLVHYMPQNAVLFMGTVEENLRYGNPDASPAELDRVIEMAQLESVIQRMPKGLKELLGPSGCQVSGGEQQRLALARAMLMRPRVLILDEATAFLDTAVEGKIFENLRVNLSDSILVVISHRLPALTWVKRHLLLDQGMLAGSGSHRDLYLENSLYREIYNSATEEEPIAETRNGNSISLVAQDLSRKASAL